MPARPEEQRAAVLLRLVDQEGGHAERREDVRQVVSAMAETVPESVKLPLLQCLEGLVHRSPICGGQPA